MPATRSGLLSQTERVLLMIAIGTIHLSITMMYQGSTFANLHFALERTEE